MEFKEFARQKVRMCMAVRSETGFCLKKCPVYQEIEETGKNTSCYLWVFNNPDRAEEIVSKWAKEHPVVTNADKYIEVIKNVFGGDVDKTKTRSVCIKYILGFECNDECTCKECLKWWDKEYKEPVKEKEQ